MITAFEWCGAGLGMLGSLLWALNRPISRFGWILFLLSNASLIVYAVNANAYGILLQQMFYMATSLLGIYRLGLWPKSLRITRFKRKTVVFTLRLRLARP